jgi:hypothetical protein
MFGVGCWMFKELDHVIFGRTATDPAGIGYDSFRATGLP